ncbi:NUDIX hydrolase [Flavobacterium kingsejongi]|uniref:Nudix hydrolase domain-containing protein n=1 Tax=Flavobacterium kingsejongi TaxID=1678728 RepID=A0A2S1LKE3_9FLAO|nr:NUDIX domain-containing protein [Flavobacterium kingsejongi]AWG24161.1 hypothetical protein FK004_02450 [Flavobacterium kingsejongi]
MKKQPTVSVIVFRTLAQDTDVLLIHHRKFDRWMVPGGHVEPVENPNEAAIREVLEETGIGIRLVSFLHQLHPVSDAECLLPPEYLYQQLIPASSKEAAHYHIDMTYIGTAIGGELTLNAAETKAVRWVPIADIATVNTFEGTRSTITDTYNKLCNTPKQL